MRKIKCFEIHNAIFDCFQPDILDGRVSSNDNRIPESIQKELDKRRIGNRYGEQFFI